ncbi:hypothetical protein ScPMuIL_007809 [Solemya velum]
MEMDNKTIAEIRYLNPPTDVHKVMMATYLVLGHDEEETRVWKNVQSLMWRTGNASIKRRVHNTSIDEVPYSVAKRAEEVLGDITTANVRLVSAGAATFYVWVNGIIEELKNRHNDSDSSEDEDMQKLSKPRVARRVSQTAFR